MANDRIYARCTQLQDDGTPCGWGIPLFKYWSSPVLGIPLPDRALQEMADHWAGHDLPLEFSLNGDPGFRFATEETF